MSALPDLADTEAVFEYTLDRLCDGDVLSDIAADLGIKRTALYKRFVDAGLSDTYTRAREEGLLTRGENLVRKVQTASLPTLSSGGIDPAAVSHLKLEVETEKWTLAKLHGRIFGDKQQIEHSGAIDLAGAVLAARKRAGKAE